MTVGSGTVEDYLERLGSASAVPGGGSAAALAGAMGTALLAMVATISARKLADPADKTRLLSLVPEFGQLRGQLLGLSQDDIDAYQAVLDARKRRAPDDELEPACIRAAEVPLQTATASHRALSLFPTVDELAWEMTRSDLEAGKSLLQVALQAALANVAVNLPDLPLEARARIAADHARLQLESRA